MPCTPPAAGVSFNEPKLEASPCNFQIVPPIPVFNLALPAIPFPPASIYLPKLHLKISCSLDKPVDVSADIAFGGGRLPCFETSPDDIPD